MIDSQMYDSGLRNTCQKYLSKLCAEIQERSVGSEGNRQATRRFMDIVEGFGWKVESTSFQAMDWDENGAELQSGQKTFEVYPSPYSLGCELEAELIAFNTIDDLLKADYSGKVVLLHGSIAQEQLMPKNFVFYNPECHQRIIADLELKRPVAIICATGRNASLAGGVYPFPLIEDGDFDIPSVYMTEEEGQKLLPEIGNDVQLNSQARRIPAIAYSLKARKGGSSPERIAISAHIDAKKGTPGAIDNATGVIVLLLLAELLQDYQGKPALELLPFNGEDYYAASGQMIFLNQNQDHWNDYLININIDGAGYHLGESAFSPFNLPPKIEEKFYKVIQDHQNIIEGSPWVQGDHSIFLQQEIPAVAVSSQWFINNIDVQDVTHTPKDHPGIVDCEKVVEISKAIRDLIEGIVLK